LIAPLAISDARQLKNENTSRCAVREFLYGSQKIRTRRQFGEGFILERTVLKKKLGAFGFLRFDFFHELLDWQVTD